MFTHHSQYPHEEAALGLQTQSPTLEEQLVPALQTPTATVKQHPNLVAHDDLPLHKTKRLSFQTHEQIQGEILSALLQRIVDIAHKKLVTYRRSKDSMQTVREALNGLTCWRTLTPPTCSTKNSTHIQFFKSAHNL